MPSEPPIACSLSAPELRERLDAIAALGRAGLIAAERDGAGVVLRFQRCTRPELAAIVAAEAECCAFLSMDLHDEPDAAVLRIEAPAGAESLLRDLVSVFGA